MKVKKIIHEIELGVFLLFLAHLEPSEFLEDWFNNCHFSLWKHSLPYYTKQLPVQVLLYNTLSYIDAQREYCIKIRDK